MQYIRILEKILLKYQKTNCDFVFALYFWLLYSFMIQISILSWSTIQMKKRCLFLRSLKKFLSTQVRSCLERCSFLVLFSLEIRPVEFFGNITINSSFYPDFWVDWTLVEALSARLFSNLQSTRPEEFSAMFFVFSNLLLLSGNWQTTGKNVDTTRDCVEWLPALSRSASSIEW